MAFLLLGSALASVTALTAQSPEPVQQAPAAAGSRAAEIAARERATDAALLAAFEARRAEIARTSMPAEDKSYAIAFLDRQIANLRSRLGN